MSKENKNSEKIAVKFVLNVLRQHENDLDRLITELDLIVDKFGSLSEKLNEIANEILPESKKIKKTPQNS